MKKMLSILSILLLGSISLFAQVKEIGKFNANQFNPADTLRPWADITNHVRGACYADDLDGDGKREVIATDYTNSGRVHVLEYNDGALEWIWSSPANLLTGGASLPRWVQSGDLDGDGMKEIIFPLGPANAGAIEVFEFTGTDNDFGTESIIDFPSDLHSSLGIGLYRTNRERGTVYDFDGDGRDELITANYDGKVYILSINGNAPGFASWQIEGGDPTVHPNNGFSGGSWWQSVPCDYDGDGVKEIVNHYWNFYGMWSIEPTGPDTYTYPSQSNPDGLVNGPVYVEFTKEANEDAVCYMGINPCDVDGDGKQELVGALYVGGGSPLNYSVGMTSLSSSASGVEVWSQDQFAILKDTLWTEVGLKVGEYWGTNAADLDGDGKDEIVLGGSPGRYITIMKYNGAGSILDGDNYTTNLYPIGDPMVIAYKNYDSLGVQWTDTTYGSFVAKTDKGDINQNGKEDILLAYQSVDDSVVTTNYTWDADSSKYDKISVTKVLNEHAYNIRIIEGDAGTGIKVIDMKVVSPDDYTLEQNYPNPFNPTTSIQFSLPVSKKVSLKVYDMLGKEIKTLVDNQEFAKGSYEANWDATNNAGIKVGSGNYIATLKYGNFTKSIKMTLVK